MIKLLDIWLKIMMLISLVFIAIYTHKISQVEQVDYKEEVLLLKLELMQINKVLADMNTLDFYNKGKKFRWKYRSQNNKEMRKWNLIYN